MAPSPTTATTVTAPRLLPLATRPVRTPRLPPALPRPDDLVRRQRVRERRARLRRPRADGFEGRPRLRPRCALAAAGALPARGRDLGRSAAAAPGDGRLQRRERPEPGRRRGAAPLGPCPHLAARCARGRERREFSSRPWLWAIVAQFGFVNAAEQGCTQVLGPAIAKAHLGGAAAWGLVLTAQSLGLLAGGLLLLRLRPRRLLLAATLGFLLTIPFLLALSVPVALVAVVAAAAIGGIGTEIFGVLWETTLQQEISQEKLSRVSAYDALGSYVLIPLGVAVAGPVAQAIGTREAILGAATLSLTVTLAVLLVRDVRTIERHA